MSEQSEEAEKRPQRVRLTVQLNLNAYEAISELQREHRRKTGRALPIWKVIDEAIRAYAKQQGIEIKD